MDIFAPRRLVLMWFYRTDLTLSSIQSIFILSRCSFFPSTNRIVEFKSLFSKFWLLSTLTCIRIVTQTYFGLGRRTVKQGNGGRQSGLWTGMCALHTSTFISSFSGSDNNLLAGSEGSSRRLLQRSPAQLQGLWRAVGVGLVQGKWLSLCFFFLF